MLARGGKLKCPYTAPPGLKVGGNMDCLVTNLTVLLYSTASRNLSVEIPKFVLFFSKKEIGKIQVFTEKLMKRKIQVHQNIEGPHGIIQ